MSRPVLHPVLSLINAHDRDANIEFEETSHKYTILVDPESKYTSVTTWIHSMFPSFNAALVIKQMMRGKGWKEGHKYWGLSADQIKAQWAANGAAVSGAGTDMHYQIECFMNNPDLAPGYTHEQLRLNYYLEKGLKEPQQPSSLEWEFFQRFVCDFPHLKPFRTEWVVYDEELKLAGSIDMVYENPDGTLSIYDWKRSKDITKVDPYNKYGIPKPISHLHNSNFWHYAIQLNTYKAILERKYGKKVTYLCLVRLHPDAEEGTYELLEVPDLSTEINELFLPPFLKVEPNLE